MLNAQLNTVQWVSLPINIRMRLVQLFHIPRSSGSLVQDNKVVSDGYTHDDLARITVEKMQALLDSDEKDFFKLFQMVTDSLSAPPEIVAPLDVVQSTAFTLPWIGEVPKDFTLNIGGKEYMLVEKKERLGVVTPDDLKKVIGTDEPKAKRKYVSRGQRTKRTGRRR